MKKLSFDFNVPQIEVNGHIFDLQISDIDVLEAAILIADEFRGLTEKDPLKIVAAVRKCESVINSILGEGALAKITSGKPVGLVDVVKVLDGVTRSVVMAYNDKISDEYDIFA